MITNGGGGYPLGSGDADRFEFLEIGEVPPAHEPAALPFYAAMRRRESRGTGLYVLEGHTPVPAEEAFPTGDVLLQWGWWFERRQRAWARVRETHFGPRSQWRVSTVFLGLDHGFARYFGGSTKPVLFELMIFGGPLSDWQERYTTWEAAVAGHEQAVRLARATVVPLRPRKQPPKKRRR